MAPTAVYNKCENNGHVIVGPILLPVEITEQLLAFFRAHLPELQPERRQLGGCQKDDVEVLDHQGRELGLVNYVCQDG